MATTAQTLIDAAVAFSLANDEGQTDLANNTTELVDVLNRAVGQTYADAARPGVLPEQERWDFFASSASLVLGSGFTALGATYAWTPQFYLSNVKVGIVTTFDLNTVLAELPPAILLRQNQVKGAGRTGDPVQGNTLTVVGTVVPATMTAGTDYVGATTLADATTTYWPEAQGNPYLVAELALYLAIKAGDRDPAELQDDAAKRDRAYSQLMKFLRRKQT